MKIDQQLAVCVCVCLLLCLHAASACNEALCASIASKCLLTGSCRCDTSNITNCTCCRDCSVCLDTLYEECCSCFQMCPSSQKNSYDSSELSEVGEFVDPMPQLLQLLTEKADEKKRWTTFSFPVDHQLFSAKHKYQVKLVAVSSDSEDQQQQQLVAGYGGGGASPADRQVTVNCTVAFLANCRAQNKCWHACQSMGASFYRWFLNGCCECIGDTCLNFGINQSRCENCSRLETDDATDEHETVSEDQLDSSLAESVVEMSSKTL